MTPNSDSDRLGKIDQEPQPLGPRVPPDVNLQAIQSFPLPIDLPLPIEVLKDLAVSEPLALMEFLDKRHQREIEIQRDKQQKQHELLMQKQQEMTQAKKASRNSLIYYLIRGTRFIFNINKGISVCFTSKIG
jgi:hypothetical protein